MPKASVTSSTTHTKRLRQVAPEQRRDRDRHQDQRAAHGRRAGLGQVRLRAVVAHRLADLVGGELADHVGPEDQRDRERGEAGEHRAQRDVAEDVEQRARPWRATGRARAASVTSCGLRRRSAQRRRAPCVMKREPLTEDACVAPARSRSAARSIASKCAAAGAERLRLRARSLRPARSRLRDASSPRVAPDLARGTRRPARRLRPCRRAPARVGAGQAARARRSRRAPSPGWRCSCRRSASRRSRACFTCRRPGVRAERARARRAMVVGRMPAAMRAGGCRERVAHVVQAGMRAASRAPRPPACCSTISLCSALERIARR